jgi:general secretion pathway protein H
VIPRSTGFTLIELLIVMVILALGAAAVGPRLWGALTPDPARDLPRQLQDHIDKLRSDAILKRNTQTATLDLDSNTLIEGDADRGWQPPNGWRFDKDELAESTVPVAAEQPGAPALPPKIRLAFMPDGSAANARFVLIGPTPGQGWRFSVSPITGRLTISPLSQDEHAPS